MLEIKTLVFEREVDAVSHHSLPSNSSARQNTTEKNAGFRCEQNDKATGKKHANIVNNKHTFIQIISNHVLHKQTHDLHDMTICRLE